MKKITKEMVEQLFVTRDAGGDSEMIVYSDVYLFAPENTTEHDLYELVSNIAYNSGLSHGFSFEIMSRACMVLSELDWDEIERDDIECAGLFEAVESNTPVYNYDLLKIANVSDYHHIDEAREVFGNEIDTITACQNAWASLIEVTAQQIYSAVTKYNNAR